MCSSSLIDSAKSSAVEPLQNCIIHALGKDKKVLAIGFDCSWFHVQNASQDSKEFIYQNTLFEDNRLHLEVCIDGDLNSNKTLAHICIDGDLNSNKTLAHNVRKALRRYMYLLSKVRDTYSKQPFELEDILNICIIENEHFQQNQINVEKIYEHNKIQSEKYANKHMELKGFDFSQELVPYKMRVKEKL
ncbi:18476_t:CDS:2 [Gigaspora margarita]|uniref:18476_t:CDS:1 n=1 Tax=Gigaspora margarita TaxID=4874 RepID=A0ABN7VAA3_GIGMA|nr:18476_t:CDS:2 [Gigaspora margarita]